MTYFGKRKFAVMKRIMRLEMKEMQWLKKTVNFIKSRNTVNYFI